MFKHIPNIRTAEAGEYSRQFRFFFVRRASARYGSIGSFVRRLMREICPRRIPAVTEMRSKNPIRDPDALFLRGELVIRDPAHPCRYREREEFRVLDIGDREVLKTGKHLLWCRVRCLGCNTRIGRLRDLSVFPLNKRNEVMQRSTAARSWSETGFLAIAHWGSAWLIGVTAIVTYKLHLAGLLLSLGFGAAVVVAFWLLVVGPRQIMTTEINQWESGKCPACGFDSRASPDRCPKCGAALAPKDS